MKKSRRPKKKEDQKSKTKKVRKKGDPVNKKATEESNFTNPGSADLDDGRGHAAINVPPPPRFSEEAMGE
ncbi:hypothetical protein BIW11_04005 [Tropilaelaps mercedesae]|uniref:Uncharacterized protein n=1 Tax=Tropilaelaps mercedesae TaxID=418985 RepID=A0A1V9XCY9_9ACAR|nr:hypothetical protein BIW11_04005 [Tropilaelaps mercedesae]